MSTTPVLDDNPDIKNKCDNCQTVVTGDKLDPICDLWQRLTPGGVVPSGQCPECQCFMYPYEEPEPPLYPEHEKLKDIHAQSQKCGQFYEWLQEVHGVEMESHFEYEKDEDDYRVWRDRDGNIIVEDYLDPDGLDGIMRSKEVTEKYRKMRDELGIHCRLLPTPGGPHTLPIRKPLAGLLAEFFEIDEDKLEAEKRAMLDACRALHEKPKKK